jgi:hypothetical protein
MNNRLTEDAMDRRFCMFLFGANGKEIALCFDQTRQKLIMGGAKPSKVAGQYEEQVRFLARLRNKNRDVVCTWFRDNCHFDGLPQLGEAIRQYQSLEEVAVRPKDEASKFWRTILREYVQPKPDPLLEEFLSGGVLPNTLPGEVPSVLSLPVPSHDIDAFLAAASGECDDATPSQPFPAFLMGVAGILQSDPGLLETGRDLLSRQGEVGNEVLLPVLDVLAASKCKDAKRPQGLHTRAAAKLASIAIADAADYAVLGYRSKVTQAGLSFVKICALLHDGTLVDLGPDDAAHLFPTTGDAVAHAKAITGYPQDYDGFSAWRVEHGRSDMSAQFTVSRWLGPVYEIVAVPHPSTEPNRVREWLLEGYCPDPNVYPLFHLEDGVLAKLATGIKDPRQVDFDLPLQGYKSLRAVEWRGRRLVIEPLPAPDLKLDCSPPATLVKRLFKFRSGVEGLASLTRAQVQQLVDFYVAEGSADPTATRQRDLEDLASLLDKKETVEEAIAGILKLPSVQQAIAEEKVRAVEAMRNQREAEQAVIDGLRSARQVLEQDIQRMKEAQKKQAGELAGEVRKAFDRASADGTKVLADVALLNAFLGQPTERRQVTHDARPAREPGAAAPMPPVLPTGRQLVTVKDINVAITRHCIFSGLGQGFVKAMVAAAASGSVVALVGSRTRLAATMLSSILAGGIGCRVAVTADLFGAHDLMNAPAIVANGDIQGMRLGDFISSQQAAGIPTVVHLNGANRAPLESFVPELVAAATSRGGEGALAWSTREGEPMLARIRAPLVFVLDFASGKSTFPLAAPLAWEVPVFDTDSTWFDADVPDTGSEPAHSHVAAGFWDAMREKAGAIPAKVATMLGPFGAAAAGQMAGACHMLDMEPGDAVLLGLAAYAAGRASEEAASQVLGALQDPLATDVSRYLSGPGTRALGLIFDMNEGVAR